MYTKSTGWWLFLGGLGIGLVFRAIIELGETIREQQSEIKSLTETLNSKPVKVAENES